MSNEMSNDREQNEQKREREMMPQPHGGALQRGGPGRPKGSISLTSELAHYLNKNPDKKMEVVLAAIEHAKAGNAAILKLIWDRIDGPVMAEALDAGGIQVVFVNRGTDADD